MNISLLCFCRLNQMRLKSNVLVSFSPPFFSLKHIIWYSSTKKTAERKIFLLRSVCHLRDEIRIESFKSKFSMILTARTTIWYVVQMLLGGIRFTLPTFLRFVAFFSVHLIVHQYIHIWLIFFQSFHNASVYSYFVDFSFFSFHINKQVFCLQCVALCSECHLAKLPSWIKQRCTLKKRYHTKPMRFRRILSFEYHGFLDFLQFLEFHGSLKSFSSLNSMSSMRSLYSLNSLSTMDCLSFLNSLSSLVAIDCIH